MPSLETQQHPDTQTAEIERSPVQSPFKYVVILEPLGLLYGSAGRFLSPENLVGRSGTQFPPSSAVLSGVFAYQLGATHPDLFNLQLAGPFWAKSGNPQNFYVPTPLNCLVEDGKIQHVMAWHRERNQWQTWMEGKDGIEGEWKTPPNAKFQNNTWLAIRHWKRLQKGQLPPISSPPWKFVPHLHPRLKEDERRVVDPEKSDRGSLFLENGVQLDPDACLVYLSNTAIADGCYRFGGEGHLVDLRCKPMGKCLANLFDSVVGRSFATLTPAVWGTNRRSYRTPDQEDGKPCWPKNSVEALLTQRPTPFRYRLGDSPNSLPNSSKSNPPKRLSRGRYAVPPGTVYVLETPLPNWQAWDENWFPVEGVSFKRWGCGLALPLASAIAKTPNY
jgi:CRISPR-associated protein Cmr3